MIALSLGLGLALAAKPTISLDPKAPTPAWLVGGHAPQARTNRWEDCAFVPIEQKGTVPAGVRVEVWLVEDEHCKEPVLRVRFAPDGWPRDNEWFMLPREAISLSPPKVNPWVNAPVQREAYLGLLNPHPFAVVQSLADLDRQPVSPFGEGERVSVLHEGWMSVFRTSTGATYAGLSFHLRDIARDPYSGTQDARALRDRMATNRHKHEAKGPIGFPPADGVLWPRDQGRTFSFEVGRDDVSAPQYDPAWLEPVGQVYRHACAERRKPLELCGGYYLDYSSFGAWRPKDLRDAVVAEVTGTRTVDGEPLPVLRVLVKEPWSTSLRVSPDW